MAAIARSGSAAGTGGGSTTAGSAADPTGIADGAVELLFTWLQATTGGIATPPAGWQPVPGYTFPIAANSGQVWVYWRVYRTGAASPSWTFSGTSPTWGAITIGFSGVDLSNPFGTRLSNASGASGLAATVPALTTRRDQSWAVSLVGLGSGSATLTPPAAPWSQWSGVSGTKKTAAADQGPLGFLASTTADQWTLGTSNPWVTVTLELQAADDGQALTVVQTPHHKVGPRALRQFFRRATRWLGGDVVQQATTPVSNSADAPFEALAGVAASVADPLDAAGAVASALADPYEAVQALATTRSDPLEATQGIAVTASDPLEATGGVASTGADPYEAVKTLVVIAADPFESITGLATTQDDPYESNQGIATTGADPIEALRGIVSTGIDPLEALQAIASSLADPYEAVGAPAAPVSNASALPYESVQGIVTALGLPLEALGGIAATRADVLESLTAVVVTDALPMESLAPAVSVVTVPYEAARGIAQIAVVPYETLQRIAVASADPFEVFVLVGAGHVGPFGPPHTQPRPLRGRDASQVFDHPGPDAADYPAVLVVRVFGPPNPRRA